MRKFDCEVCNNGPTTTGEAVFRTAPLGETPAHWRCRQHLPSEHAPDAVTDEIVSIIEADARKDTP